MRMEAQSGATWDPVATASHQVGPNGDTTWEALLRFSENVLRISDWAGYVPHCEAISSSTWAKVAPKWVPKLCHLGANLGRSWSQVGPSWAEAVAEVDPKCCRCCGHAGSKRCIRAMLGRYATCENYGSENLLFWRRVDPENAQLKLTDRSIRTTRC